MAHFVASAIHPERIPKALQNSTHAQEKKAKIAEHPLEVS